MKKTILELPKEFRSVADLINSKEFKEYLENNRPKLKTGSFSLDKILKGGIPKEKITMICGKSTLPSVIASFIKFKNKKT